MTYHQSVNSDNVKDTLRTEQSVPQPERLIARNILYHWEDVLYWWQGNHSEVSWNDEHQVGEGCLG